MKTRGSNYRLKYYDFWFLGKKYIGCIYPWDNFPGGSFPRGHLFKGQLCRGQIIRKTIFLGSISREILSGGNFLWSNCLGAIIRRQSSRGTIFLGGNYPRGQLSGEQLSRGKFPRGQLSSGAINLEAIIQGIIIQGAIVRGAIFLEGNCPDTIFCIEIAFYS